jgi:hypothetical protein
MRCALDRRTRLPVGQKGRANAPARISVTKMRICSVQSARAAILGLQSSCRMPTPKPCRTCRRDRPGCCTRRARADHSRRGGLAHHARAQAPGQPHAGSAAACLPGTECRGKHLAIPAADHLSNSVFENYTAILDACQFAWRSLLNEFGRIASIASRDWTP